RGLRPRARESAWLAGAQDLVPTVANPNGSPSNALYYAASDTLSVFNQTPTHSKGANFYNSPPGGQVTDTKGGYTVTVTAPTGFSNKQVQVDVSTQASATFAEVIGFNRISIFATAPAEAGTNAKTYAIFAYAGIGNGNVIKAQFAAAGQVDNAQNGSDACDLT